MAKPVVGARACQKAATATRNAFRLGPGRGPARTALYPDNDSSLPVAWLELEDRSDLPGYGANLATGIEGHQISQWRKHGICQQRGLYTLGPTIVHTSDPLGLYQVTIHDPAGLLARHPLL